MKEYQSVQVMWVLLFVPLFMIAMLFMYAYQIGSKPISGNLLVVLEILFGAVLLLFFQLKTTITYDKLILAYGIGLIKININLEDVATTRIVRNRWYYGIGIRIIPGGILYNAHGLDAVELSLKNKRRKIRIGTQEPNILKDELDKRLLR